MQGAWLPRLRQVLVALVVHARGVHTQRLVSGMGRNVPNAWRLGRFDMSDDLEKPSLLAAFEHYQILVLGPDRGSWIKCQCPMPDHEDSNPSASVNEEAGRWRCHTCDKGGDVFDLIMEQEPGVVGFSAAVKRAAELFGDGDSEVRGERGGSGLLPRRSGDRKRGGVHPAPWMRL